MTGISDETYELLRKILQKQNHKAYTLEDAKQIGDGLIDFYKLLIDLSNEKEQSTRLRNS